MIKYTCGAGTPEEAETNCTYFIRGECTASFCEYRRKKRTNADRIRAMSDEELAWELMLWRCEAVAKHHGIESQYPDTQSTILGWLRKPVEEDDDDK